MSLSNVIGSIKTNVENAYSVINEKHGSIPENKNIENLAFAVSTIDTKDNYARLIEHTATQIVDGDVKFLPTNAINNQPNLKMISFPNASYIYGSTQSPAVSWCPNLTSIYLENCRSIGAGNGSYTAFSNCGSITTLYVPNVSYIGNYAFQSCRIDCDLDLPMCLIIQANAFYSGGGYKCIHSNVNLPICSSLGISVFTNAGTSNNYFNAPYMKAIEQNCFSGANFKSLSFPYLTYIGQYAFSGMANLEEAYMPNVQNFQSYAFINCSKLKSMYLPAFTGGTSIFNGCSSLESVYFFNASTAAPAIGNAWDSTPMVNSTYLGHYGSIYVPATKVSNYKNNWTSVSNRITELPEAFGPSKVIYAFEYYNLSKDGSEWLTSIPESRANVEMICPYAFAQCRSLTNVNLPYCKSIMTCAFSSCSNITSLSLPEVEYIGTLAFSNCSRISSSLYLPKCKYIDGQAFMQCSNIDGALYIPEVEWIGASAFSYCSRMTGQLNMPKCKYIDQGAFYNCHNIETLNTNAFYIGQAAFQNCSNLQFAVLPELRWLYNYAFQSCNLLSYVDAPKVQNINTQCFQSCPKLASVNIPNCENIWQSAFSNCGMLSSINMQGCRMIGSSAFYNCNLTSVYLPNCSSIYNGAFENNTNLSTIVLTASSVCTLYNSSAFNNTQITSSTGSIFVRPSLVSAFKEATNWTFFADRIFPSQE